MNSPQIKDIQVQPLCTSIKSALKNMFVLLFVLLRRAAKFKPLDMARVHEETTSSLAQLKYHLTWVSSH
jgi:hypothetical protein